MYNITAKWEQASKKKKKERAKYIIAYAHHGHGGMFF